MQLILKAISNTEIAFFIKPFIINHLLYIIAEVMKSERTKPIGVFDSGVGGLTVVKGIRKYLPNEDIIYFGDTARVPYGNKSKETITRFSHEIMSFLLKNHVKMAVVACNTASSLSLNAIKNEYGIPVIGVIAPGVKEAERLTQNKRIGVIGTNSTISSKSYDKTLAKLNKSCKIFSESCPLFVPLVENRVLRDKITYLTIEKYLDPIKKKNIDTLILGCTHYPIIKKAISRAMKGVKLVDSSISVAKEVREVLEKKDLQSNTKKKKGKISYFVSDDPKSFEKTAHIFLKKKIHAKKVAL